MMEHIVECVVCDASIWPVAHGHLCYKHRITHARMLSDPRMVELLRQVSFGERTDFPGDGDAHGGFNHVFHQLAARRQPGHWVVELDDILRMYGVHCEQEERRGPGHDESEAA